jgi:uncharacterized membrane protein YsdA (DUF1294 family)
MQWIIGLLVLGLDVALTAALQQLPLLRNVGTVVIIWMIAINLIALVMYRYDKSVAGTGVQRIPETTLQLLALIGGTFGAYLGMWLPPHHKTSKTEFQIGYWSIVAIQAAAVYFLTRQG